MATAARLASGIGGLAPRARPERLLATRLGGLSGSWVSRRCVFVSGEATPNPSSMMFQPRAKDVLGPNTKTLDYTDKYDSNDSPLASALFRVRGVAEVHLAARHVTVKKTDNANWENLQPNVELVMSQFFAAGLGPVREGVVVRVVPKDVVEGSIEAQIIELLDERVRPFVQQDGGDVEFHTFEPASGTLYVRLTGACSGCPKSNVTLQFGIKNMMEHYISEVKEVIDVNADEAGEEPQDDTSRPRDAFADAPSQ